MLIPSLLARSYWIQIVKDDNQKAISQAKKGETQKELALQALATAIRRLEKHPENVNVGSKDKHITPLMLATGLGHKDAIRWLVAHGADPSVKDKEGRDSFSRTEDETITELLKEGGIFSWEQALAHVESIRPADWPQTPEELQCSSREDIISTCRARAEGSEGENLINPFTLAGDCLNLGDMKMVSFLARTEKEWDSHGIQSHIGSAIRSPLADKRIAMLNLLVALGATCDGSEYGSFRWLNAPELKEDKQVQAWILNTFPWHQYAVHGCFDGQLDVVKAAFARARQQKVDTDMLQKVAAYCLGAALASEDKQVLNYIFQQDRGGMCTEMTIANAVGDNQLDVLKRIMAEKPTRAIEVSREDWVVREQPMNDLLRGSIWWVNEAETFLYIYSLLEEEPKPDYMAHALREAAQKKNVALVKVLLAHKADPEVRSNGDRALDADTTEEIRKLMQEVVDKKKG